MPPWRGRGPAGGGRGRGRRGGRSARGGPGPALPFRLAREVDAAADGGRWDGREGLHRRLTPADSGGRRGGRGGRGRGLGRGGGGKRGRGRDGDEDGAPRKRPRPAPGPRTKFEELLQGNVLTGTSDAAFEAEDALQRRLAKKLGLKGKAKAARGGADAGLGLGGGAGSSGSGSEGELSDGSLLGDGGSVSDDGSGSDGGGGVLSSGSGSGGGLSSGSDGGGCLSSGSDGGGLSSDSDGGSLLQSSGSAGAAAGAGAGAGDVSSGSDRGDAMDSGDDALPGDGSDGESGSAGASSGDGTSDGASSDGDGVSGSASRSSDDDDGDVHAKAGRPPKQPPKGSPPNQPPQPPTPAAASAGRYLPPAARAVPATADPAAGVRRQVTGLFNRLAESNLPSVGGDVAALLRGPQRAAARAAACAAVVSAAAAGPRATPAHAAVAAALVAGAAGAAGSPALAAECAAGAATALESAVAAGDGVAAANLVALIAALYTVGILRAPALYDMLAARLDGFSEADVAAAAGVLRAVGGRLRSDDPAAMKALVLRASAAAGAARAAGTLSPRADALLGLVLDVKNNRRGGQAGGRAPGALGAGAARWLRECGADAVALHGVGWRDLLAPGKRGEWWLPPPAGAGRGRGGGGLDVTTPTNPSARAASPDDTAATDLLRLAAAQRMTTEPRRAAFCVVMGAADPADAAERLLRLPLRGDAAREIVRVPMDCCLQEAAWNPYYLAVLRRVTRAARAHRATLRMAARDALRAGPAWPARRGAALARLAGGLVACHALPLSAVAGVAAWGGPLDAPTLVLWRALLRHALAAAADRDAAAAPFRRFAAAASRGDVVGSGGGSDGDGGGAARPPAGATPAACAALRAFIRSRLAPWLPSAGPAGAVGVDELTLRARDAERALAAAARLAPA